MMLLIGLGVAALSTSRMILWWAPVAGWVLALHGSAGWDATWETRLYAKWSGRSWKWTVSLAALAMGVAACTPLGMARMYGRELDLEKCVSRQTPIGAADYLRARPPAGLIFNTYEWGDYLLWAGPRDLKVFVHSHAHLVPPDVWRDYMSIGQGSGKPEECWKATLESYGINTVVVDPARQPALVDRLRRSGAWHVCYEDERSLIFVRRDASRP